MKKEKTTAKKVFAPAECFAKAKVITLKFHLRGTKSVRVVTLPSNMRMYWLAKIIMDCFGFQEYHLYHFEDKRFNVANEFHGIFAAARMIDSEAEQMHREVIILQKTIAQVFPGCKEKATFLYDYGDDWHVEITRMADRKNAGMFECVKSEGMNAYEDIGGCWRLEYAREMCEKIQANPAEREKLDEGDTELLNWLLGEEEKHFEENLRYFLATPSREEIVEVLRDYNTPIVLKCVVPDFYDEIGDEEILEMLSDEDEEEDSSKD